MPIRKELRHFYRGPAYEATRARIQQRAKNKCEQCGKPNHRRVWVVSAYDFYVAHLIKYNYLDGHFFASQFWSSVKGDGQRWRSCTMSGKVTPIKLRGAQWTMARKIRVICTMAHLDHDPAHNDDSNLKFLCQWCHLNYDKLHHKETRSIRKDAQRPILQEVVA